VFALLMPDATSIERIYCTITEWYFIPECRFSATVVDIAKEVVCATREIWSQVQVKMLPTPAQFHSTFNLRDLSRIAQGIIQVTTKTCNDPESVVTLWANECSRIWEYTC
jgi:dynein heavy chain